MSHLFLTLVQVCSVNACLIGATSPNSIFNLPPDIQIEHVWSCWNRTEQKQIRCLSKTCKRLHDELLFDQYSRESSMYQLYLSISHLQQLNDTLAIDRALEGTFVISPVKHVPLRDLAPYIIMVEKVLCQMIANFGDWEVASRLCNHFICHLELNVSLYPRIKVMRSMITGLHLIGEIAQNSLSEMFWFGAEEMDKTGNKYNRYTRFGLTFLDIIDDLQHHPKFNSTLFNRRISRIWNNIHRAEFIEDYLKREVLRTFPEYVHRAAFLVVDSALGSRGLCNTNKLMLIVKYPHLFFDFGHIMISAVMSGRSNERNLMHLLKFLTRNGLMTWKEVRDQLHRIWLETNLDALHFLYSWVVQEYHTLRLIAL